MKTLFLLGVTSLTSTIYNLVIEVPVNDSSLILKFQEMIMNVV